MHTAVNIANYNYYNTYIFIYKYIDSFFILNRDSIKQNIKIEAKT